MFENAGADVLLPPAKCVAFAAILEDAQEQLAVLHELTPEPLKSDTRATRDRIKALLTDQKDTAERQASLALEIEAAKAAQVGKARMRELQLAATEVSSHFQSITFSEPNMFLVLTGCSSREVD